MLWKYKIALTFCKYFVKLTAFSFYCVYWMFIRTLDYIINTFSYETYHSSTKSVKTGRILLRQKFSTMALTQPLDFVCMFRDRVRPNYVLQPNVSLYRITSKEAIFVETPASINIYSSEVASFSFIAQFQNATKVIKMPIKDFVSLAEKIGDPTIPVVWMSSTGRCGGTMVCQMFETVPGTIAIHEPDPPSHLNHLYGNNKFKKSEYEAILQSMVRIMCNKNSNQTTTVVFYNDDGHL